MAESYINVIVISKFYEEAHANANLFILFIKLEKNVDIKG